MRVLIVAVFAAFVALMGSQSGGSVEQVVADQDIRHTMSDHLSTAKLY